MPSAVTPQRRSRENSSDEHGSQSSAAGGPSTKRARINLNGDASRTSPSPLPTNGYRSHGNAVQQQETLRARRSKSKHQPGSIVRAKLANFVTYTAVEFLPGPSLNMVIGPNGTGKSTLVCALCLGLGWGPQHLGRAKDVSEFVKHGEQEATIEIELAGDPKRHRRNPVIKCNIKRENNKSTFSIDGKPSNKKAVIELCRSFTIQIDNLCQFLPQDKVVEFAAMTPVELLRSTQRAVAPQEMLDMHDELKEHRQKQRNIQAKAHADQDALDNLENRQRMQADDVQRMRDREVIKERVRLMEVSRPFPAYREAKVRFANAKESKKEAVQKLAELKEEIEPSLGAINAKTAYQCQIEAVVNGRRRMAQDAEKITDNIDRKLQTLHSRKGELEAEAEAEKNGGRESRKDITRQQGFIATLKRRMDEEQPGLDISGYNERIRGKQKAIDEAAQKVLELKRQMEDITSRGQGRKERILQAQKELQKLESQAGQQENKLRQASQDTFKAWEWIKEHQDQFENPVFGPPMVECSVTDPKYVDQIETLLQRGQMLMITCQTKNDFKKLGDILHDRMHLAEINMQHMTGTLADFPPPIDRDQLGRYGLTGWALDYMSGPEPVMAMLCANVRLERTGVGDQDTTPEQFELLQNGPIENWVTKRSSYKIVRRREYGPSATSTNVRDVRRAQVWTNQPIDIRAKRDLQENIEGWTGEITEYQSQVATAQKEIEELRDTVRETQDEVRNLQTEKAGKQKLLSEFRALPTKLAQQEEKLATAQQSLSEMRQRLGQISEKREQLTGERAEAAMDYVAAVETLQARHLELYEGEIMLIEANSDLATLAGKNAAQKELLELREREVEHLGKEVKARRENAMRLMDKVKEVMASIEEKADAALAEHVKTMSDQQSSEQLEEEIESEKARLELMHEGNDRGLIKEFESREKRISTLKSNLEGLREELEQAGERIQGVRERWEPELDRLVGLISKSFGENMKEIGCAGEVGVSKEDDFENWSIKILVKFRETEPLTALDSHRQSGGERAVSTIFYLMSLQSLTRSPFRVVDEINQGMDPRNERLVHRRMVGIACGGDGLLNDSSSSSSSNGVHDGAAAEGRSFDSVTVVNGDGGEDDEVGLANANGGGEGEGSGGAATIPQSQYFLITPKLLPSLTYARGMRVLCIASGEHMPASADKVDFRGCVDLARGLRREVVVR
ncbi:Structural maintenance of chromosomes protein 5 [Xanthoria calcicola]